MTGVSGPDLVVEACAAGIVGAFPTENTATVQLFDHWLTEIESRLDRLEPARPGGHGPLAVNLVMRRARDRLDDEVDVISNHRVDLVITSVGSPEPVIESLHRAGTAVLADVATMRHARRALEAGADGLILLSAGAGGQTGWMNPFAFVRAVRAIYDGPLVLAGGVADGASLWASLALGCDLAYMGTAMIATEESLASAEYKKAVVESEMDDVELYVQPSGIAASMLRTATPPAPGHPPSAFSAGHSVSMVSRLAAVRHVVDRIEAEFERARDFSW
jgi:nitronate monooxygenase